MSIQPEENIHSHLSEDVTDPILENENEISAQEPLHLTAESELLDDKQDNMKTTESQDNDITEDEQANTKRSRELKLLLALSKEANLDVNISHKRKSLDPVKLKEIALPSSKIVPENEPLLKKSKIDKFPITAESEIENMDISSVVDVPDVDKSRKEDIVVSEERKHIKDVKVFKPNKDIFCWRCHREGVNVACETCPRSYHQKCLKQTIFDVDNWPCPECVSILKAESTQTRSPAMRGMTLEHLCSLLKFAVKRMIECNGSEPFHHAVNDKLFPEYKKYIIQPMNLTLLEKNIKENLYGSTQAFEADAKWILHNSIIFNSYQSKLTTSAKMIIKICKQEMAEVENCPSCYLNANTKKSTWFVEVCPKPHILVWAKLKGFPYWPAKAMCTNNSGMVDVRFFGAHDRAWVPSKECFLYSRRDPNSNKQKRNDIIECMREVEVYIANIKALYGEFNYAPFKMQYDPENELKQLLLFIPRFKPNAPPPKKRLKTFESKTKAKKDESEEKEDKEEKEESKEVLEGYGTDDETLENEALDSLKRKLLLQQASEAGPSVEKDAADSSGSEEEEVDDNIEPEIDDDTQVSGNSLNDKIPSNVRTRGSQNISPEKLKSISRRISEESVSKKRLSSEELSPPNKIARRNSDQSIKSDSSRLSSLSDKINRVDISENVELTLGNTADSYITSSTVELETKKKPVQVEVDNSELSISPRNKTKISDKLMQKLSSSDEDVSRCEENKKETDAKLETDIILEKYRNLVKKKSMEFSNVEASTSFGITSVVSKEVCVSSEDKESEVVNEAISEVDKESETTNDNEKSNEEQNNDASEMDISSTDNVGNVLNELEIEHVEESEGDSEKSVAGCEEKQLDEGTLLKEIAEGVDCCNEDDPAASVTIEEEEESSKTEEVIIPPKEVTPNKEEKFPANNVSAKISEEIISEKDVDTNVQVQTKETLQIEDSDSNSEKNTVKPSIEKPPVEMKVQNIDKTKVLVKSKPVVANKTEQPVKQNDSKPKIENAEKNTGATSESIGIARVEGKKIITYSRKDRKSSESKRKESPVIEQPTDSNSSDDQGLVLDDTQIDETNIRNIIHSSLNYVAKKSVNQPLDNEGKISKRKHVNLTTEDTPNKKIRFIREKEPVKESSFKIVPIQHILNKNINEKSPDYSVVSNNPILLKKLSQPTETPSGGVPGPHPLECVEIKSEPESEEDNMQESQYMDAKRKYMSALNISEKTDEVIAPKKNEIRTRSKTEEMGKGRPMDNLSRVIDEVATTFSAKHETQRKIVERKNTVQAQKPPQTPEERRKIQSQENGEIFVKSFAKMSHPPQPQMRTLQRAQPQQKPKPSAPISKGSLVQAVRREMPVKQNVIEPPAQTTLTRIASTPISTSNSSNTINTPSVTNNKTLESLSSSGNVLILTQPGVILPTSQSLTYNTGSFVTFVPSQQNMAVMQSSQVINAVMAPPLQNETVQQSHANVESRSQNYIPQNDEHNTDNTTNRSVNPPPVVNSNGATTNHLQSRDIPSLIPITDNERSTVAATTNNTAESRTEPSEDEFSLLHSMVPESVSKAISEVLCRPPPKLRPRPPGPLSQVFDSGNPSSAGPVSAKINSISHRLGDYFRGMLVELLEDLGKVNNPEATIASLKHEIETLQQKHAAEMMDIRKNVCTILKDIQGSIVEERERLVDEARSACEVEALRRIEEAKSKQWCANCGKEAQFYCCWNTSYCDYSCQIKQWSKHMSKCTQHAGQSQPGPSPAIRPQSQLTFRPANSKGFTGRLVAKPTKVYLNRSANSKSIPTFKSTAGGHLTLVDPTNLEFLASQPGTKFIATNSLFTRVRNVNSTVTSPSNGAQQTESLNQRVRSSVSVVRPSTSSSNNMSSVISDEEMDSD